MWRTCCVLKTGHSDSFIFFQDFETLWTWAHTWTFPFTLKCWASHWQGCKSVRKSSFGSSSGPECATRGLISVPDRCFHCLQLSVSHVQWNSCFPRAVPTLDFHAKFVSSASVTGAWEGFYSQIMWRNCHRQQGEKETKKTYRWDFRWDIKSKEWVYLWWHHRCDM